MADEELNNEEEKQEKSNAAGNIKLIIAGIVIVILAAGISFAVAKMAASSAAQPVQQINADAKIKSETLGTTFDAGEYITNLANGNRFIKVNVVLAFENPEMEAEVNNKLPVIKHTINRILRGQTAESLSEPKSMEKLADKLKESINELLIKGNIDNVYFTYFVVQ